MYRLRLREVLFNLIACWFFLQGFHTLSFLCNTKIVDVLRNTDEQHVMKALFNHGLGGDDMMYFLFWINISGLIGILIGFIFSLVLSYKKNMFWLNNCIAFLIIYILYRFNLLGVSNVAHSWPNMEKIFGNSVFEFLCIGIAWIALGVFIILQQKEKATTNTTLIIK